MVGRSQSLQELKTAVIRWAAGEPAIRAILLVGSLARRERPGDEWADLDLMLFAEAFDGYLAATEWLEEIGPVWVCLPHETGDGDPEWLVLFEGAAKIDFVFYPVDELRQLARTQSLPDVYQRGYHVLLDKDGLAARLPPPSHEGPPVRPPGQAAYSLNVRTFWYGAVYVAKQIRRRELWVAKYRDWTMKEQLLQMMTWHAGAQGDWLVDTWHDGRFLASWVDEGTWAALVGAFGRFDAADSWRALRQTMSLFRQLARETADRLGFDYPQELDNQVTDFVDRLYTADGP